MATNKKIRFKYIAFAAGSLNIIVALIVMVGWYTQNGQLLSVVNGYTTMKFNTSLCLLLLGKALVIQATYYFRPVKPLGYFSAGLAFAVALLTVSEHFGASIAIDQVFVKDNTHPALEHPGRMSLITASSICITAIAIILSSSQRVFLIRISQYMMHTVTLITFIVGLGYVFKIALLYTFGISTPMALHTCVCLLALSVGTSLINYKYGITAVFTGDKIGNVMARNLFVKLVVVMVVASYLDIYVQKYDVMSEGVGSAIFSVTIIFMSFIFTWETSKMLNNLDRKRELISERLSLIFEAMPNALVMGDSEGKIILVNREAEMMFGYSRDEILGKRLEVLLPKRYRAGHPGKMKSFFITPFTRHYASHANLYAVRKNGEEFPIEMGLTPVKTEDGIVGLATVIDISERKANEKTIQEQVRELKIRNQEMEQFNYIASHDLQEPLRTVSNYIVLLEEDYPADPEVELHLSAMKQATNRMSRLIKTLLDYGLLGRDKILAQTDVELILNDVRADLNNLIKTTGTTITINNQMPKLCAYETELRQLFQNLINNAIKFRKKDTSPVIDVFYEYRNGMHEFTVADNGIGINTRHYKNIFNIFQRVNREDEYEGYGVGLANCKKIAEMHGGKIWVESVYGEGSTFKFTITNIKP
jgi:PAS domain S-box-containing protein